MSLAVWQTVKGRRFLHRDVEQAHQLARFHFQPTSSQEGFNIHFPGADRYSAPAFKLPIAALFGSLQLSGTVKQGVSRRGNIFGTAALSYLIKR